MQVYLQSLAGVEVALLVLAAGHLVEEAAPREDQRVAATEGLQTTTQDAGEEHAEEASLEVLMKNTILQQ